MSDGILGYGATLAGSVSGTIGNIVSMNIGPKTVDSVEKTTTESTSAAKEFIAGLIDGGELTLTVNYSGSASGIADKLNTALDSRAAETWTATLVDTSYFQGSGFITSLGQQFSSPGDKVSQSLTIKLTGLPIFVDVAA